MPPKLYLIALFLVVVSNQLYSQDSTLLAKFLVFGAGPNFYTVQEPATSPLTYSGAGINAVLGFEQFKPKTYLCFHSTFDISGITTRNYPDYDNNKAYFLGANLFYSYMKKLYQRNSNEMLFLGGTVDVFANTRLNTKIYNSSLTYNLGSSLGVSTSWQQKFEKKPKTFKFWVFKLHRPARSYFVNCKLNVPLLSFVMLPTYITIPDFDYDDYNMVADHFDRGKFLSLNKLQRVQTSVGIATMLKNGNRINFNYSWDLFVLNNNYDKLTTALHRFQMVFYFKLD